MRKLGDSRSGSEKLEEGNVNFGGPPNETLDHILGTFNANAIAWGGYAKSMAAVFIFPTTKPQLRVCSNLMATSVKPFATAVVGSTGSAVFMILVGTSAGRLTIPVGAAVPDAVMETDDITASASVAVIVWETVGAVASASELCVRKARAVGMVAVGSAVRVP